ncbi:hypothetical protein N7522_003365 [Penicillium canescens]|nr:hypothetical protein N7522_003365 [Penicillium canescens]
MHASGKGKNGYLPGSTVSDRKKASLALLAGVYMWRGMSYAKIIPLSIRAAVLCGEMQVSTGKVDSTVLDVEANILSRPERGTDQATTLAVWLRISYF